MLPLFLFIARLTGIIDYNQIQPLLITLLLGFGIFAIPFSVMAYYLDFTRLYYYAFSTGLGFLFVDLLKPILGTPSGAIIIFGVIGGTIILIGLYYFINFLKKYPLSK